MLKDCRVGNNCGRLYHVSASLACHIFTKTPSMCPSMCPSREPLGPDIVEKRWIRKHALYSHGLLLPTAAYAYPLAVVEEAHPISIARATYCAKAVGEWLIPCKVMYYLVLFTGFANLHRNCRKLLAPRAKLPCVLSDNNLLPLYTANMRVKL